MSASISLVLVIILVALVFDFINGFHDSANSIATVVSTRVLSPGVAVLWAAFFNFIAAFTVGTAVAKTIGKGLIDPSVVDPSVVLGALVGAIVWNLVTWYFGLPSSSSHALMGGFGGAAVAKAGAVALIGSGWVKPLLFIVISPLLGMTLALLLTVALSWALRRHHPGPLDTVFRRLQLLSAGLYSLSHGANDAQKTMGIIVSLLVASQALFAEQAGMLRHLHLVSADHIPMWIVLAAHAAIALGTAAGGWRIIKTLGHKNAAIIYENSSYGKTLSSIFIDEFKKLGGTIVAEEVIEKGGRDFRSQITRIAARKPPVTVTYAYYAEGGLIVRQAAELGLKTQFISHGSIQNQSFAEIAGPAADGFISGSPRWDDNDPQVKAFIERFKKKYNREPDLYGPYFYDAVRLYAAAIEKGGYSKEGIAKGLKSLKDFPGVNGKMSFDQGNVVLLPLRFVKFEGGKWVPIKK